MIAFANDSYKSGAGMAIVTRLYFDVYIDVIVCNLEKLYQWTGIRVSMSKPLL